MNSYNQAGQEEWVREFLQDKRNGVFVDLGAYDGVESSNTYYLEKELGWTGVCIESNPSFYRRLTQTRSSTNINVAAMDYKGFCIFHGINTYKTNEPTHNSVRCDLLDTILEECNCPKDIDYMSLDIEGHELAVLQSLDFTKWNINLLTIEHNSYLHGPALKDAIFELLSQNGYDRIREDVCAPEGPYEDWYAKSTNPY